MCPSYTHLMSGACAAERNPNFRKDALAALPKNKTIAVMCSLGGTMLVGTKPREMSGKVFKSDPDRAFGRESRSLKACYELYEVRKFGMTCMYSMQEKIGKQARQNQ